MSNDVTITSTVVALQGNAVSSASPSDGYVLVWDAADGYWKPQPQNGLHQVYFTSNGTWTAPAGINSVLLIGAGGGGGGANGGIGSTNYSGGGGGGSIQTTGIVSVVPGTTYTIAIGAGGSNNSNGGNTAFGSLFLTLGGGQGYGQNNCWVGGASSLVGAPYIPWGSAIFTGGYIPQCGLYPGYGGTALRNVSSVVQSYNGQISSTGFGGGNNGSNDGTYYGAGGGGGGPQGAGAVGGNGNSTGAGGNGSNAAANTGAGGGGGAAGSTAGGTGGNGGSGYLYVIY